MPAKDEFREMYEHRLDEETLNNIQETSNVSKMKKGINDIGHKEMWELIESMSEYTKRTSMRKDFFEVGGIIPLQEKTI